MNGKDFSQIVDLVLKDDTRYGKGAYYFVRQGPWITRLKIWKEMSKGPPKHVSGQELLEGIRRYALDQYGPLTLTVFHRLEYQEVLGFWRYSV